MTLREALAVASARLAEAGVDGPARDARALVAEVAGLAADRVLIEGDLELRDNHMLDDFVARRIAGEPVSKIIGRRMFWGRDFRVTRDVLDPRPETETLIAEALSAGPVERFIDLGTGSGIIAISLLSEWPGSRAIATDLSAEAIAVARGNAETHGVEGRVDLVHVSDPSVWFPAGVGKFDLILSNPPYIAESEMPDLSREVLGYDPHIALSPGGDGLDPYRTISRQAATHLKPGGRVLVEIGWAQGASVTALFREAGFQSVRCLPDLDGRDRVIVAEV